MYVLRHERCPGCAKLGRDTKGDNLAVYSDGHTHCFGCGYHTHGDAITTYKNKQQAIEVKHPTVNLPEDVEYSYPIQALNWMKQYGFNRNNLLGHNILWSESTQLLIFPYYHNGLLFAWQGRYFGPKTDHPKWLTYGKVHEYDYILNPENERIILVEDIVSAIKLSRYESVLPLFGSYISAKRLGQLSRFYPTIIIWLDPDKQKEALQFQKIALQYCANVYVVIADKDPKELEYKQLEEILASKSPIRSSKTST
jgi:hypothetical protein